LERRGARALLHYEVRAVWLVIVRKPTDKLDTLNKAPSFRNGAAVLASVLLTAAGLAWLIGPLFWAPNTHLFTFGGDGLVHYYDAAYHLMHGKQGVMLDAMLYPNQELLFLTDAQGAWLVVWQWISRNIVDLSAYITGLIHTTNNIGVLLATPFVYAILKRLGSTTLAALLFSPLIVILSPQMMRFGGHFGLVYPFVIPMTIWWLLRERTKLDFRDVLVTLVLCFFIFNNPYVGFSAGLTLLVFGGFGLLEMLGRKQINSRVLIPSFGMGIALILPYIYFKLNDPFLDRIGLQWGVFNFRTSIPGSVFPDVSILSKVFGLTPGVEFESIQYLGIIPIVAVLGGLAYMFFRFLKSLSIRPVSAAGKTWKVYSLSALFVYLLCFNWSISLDTQLLIERYAGFLLMFKAVPRLAWPFYFVIAITGALYLSRFLTWLKEHSPATSYVVLAGIIVFYCIDIGVFFNKKYVTAHHNLFSLSDFKALDIDMKSQGVESGDFQAILSVPRQVSWNSNVYTNWKWATHFASTKTSVALGLPMINANLGRAPVRPLVDVTQLMSRQEIDRAILLDALPNNKPLLLIHGIADTLLSDGERFLMNYADTVYTSKLFTGLRLEIDTLRKYSGTLAHSPLSFEAEAGKRGDVSEESNPSGYSTDTTVHLLNTVRSEKQGNTYRTVMNSPKLDSAAQVVLSGWIACSSYRFDQGTLSIKAFDSLGVERNLDWLEVRRLPDASNGWFYLNREYALQAGDSLTVTHAAPQHILLDHFGFYNR
jgi:hypothetical protein